MKPGACHHFALRVTDLDRAIAFYEDAFDGQLVTKPFPLEGPIPEMLYGGGPGTTVRLCHVAFEDGGVELFEFSRPDVGPSDVPAYAGNIIHVAFHVEAVDAAVKRVAAAGGRLIGDVLDWGGTPFAYCADPDGNVLEIAQVGFADTVAIVHRLFPETIVGG